MILSRITKAIREQNWFAVAIEGHDAAFAEMAQRLRASDTIQPLLRQRMIETSIESRAQVYWLKLFERILPPE